MLCCHLPVVDWSVDASPPEDLRVVIPIYGSHGDVLVTWKHQTCRSPSEGYVVAFELVYCRLNDDKECTGRWDVHEFSYFMTRFVRSVCCNILLRCFCFLALLLIVCFDHVKE